MGGAASAQVIVESGITFVYLNDGYKDSYLIIIRDGKVVQNLKLEQQILSGPEVEDLIDNVMPKSEMIFDVKRQPDCGCLLVACDASN